MAAIENHLKRIREHLDELNDAIDAGMENKPVTIGFHCSACSIELLELYLHATHKITSGKVIKHNWFKRPKEVQKIEPLAERKLGVDFPDKDKIFDLIYTVEEWRENLVYGIPSVSQIEAVHGAFLILKALLSEKSKTEGINFEKS